MVLEVVVGGNIAGLSSIGHVDFFFFYYYGGMDGCQNQFKLGNLLILDNLGLIIERRADVRSSARSTLSIAFRSTLVRVVHIYGLLVIPFVHKGPFKAATIRLQLRYIINTLHTHFPMHITDNTGNTGRVDGFGVVILNI